MALFKRKSKQVQVVNAQVSPYVDHGVLQHFINSTKRTVRQITDAFGITHDGRRNTNEVFGYREEGARGYDYYYSLYRFSGIAKRVVKGIAASCWRDGAFLTRDEESEEKLLEEEMNALRNIGMFRDLEAADTLNRIGNFSVMYIGLSGDPEKPVERTPGLRLDQIYFAPYSQESVTIAKYDTEPTSSRYGLPEMYNLTPMQSQSNSTATDVRGSITAHWTRVVLLNEGALGNRINGEPALEDVANYVEDIIKIGGGSAEAFYRNIVQKFLMDIDKEFEADDTDFNTFGDRAQDFINDMKSFIGLRGARIAAVPVSIGDPMPAFLVAIQSIAGAKGIPIRILTGEGSGQFAGSEDKAAYNQTVRDRQKQYCNGYLFDTLVILDAAGLIKLPEHFVIDWPITSALDEKIESEVELNNAKAFQARAQGIAIIAGTPGADLVLPTSAMLKEAGISPENIIEAEREMKAIGAGADGDGTES